MLHNGSKKMETTGSILWTRLVTGYSTTAELEVTDHPPYILNLVLSDFKHFGLLKKHMAGKQTNRFSHKEMIVPMSSS